MLFIHVHASLVYSLPIQLYGFVSVYTQLLLILFVYLKLESHGHTRSRSRPHALANLSEERIFVQTS
jgi:hypothetical protein